MSPKNNQNYHYTESQIRRRNIQKSERVEALRKNIDRLRKKVREDLKSEDEKIRTLALVIYVIDETKARVGNRESERERGHYGVTGLLKKHLRFEGDNAVFRYTGKSGVEQKKVITDKKLIEELKTVSEGKNNEEPLFSYKRGTRQCLLDSTAVSKYLEEFGVTAKDIRGYHANQEMVKTLKALRRRSGRMPTDQKEREETLDKEFKKALELVAKMLGHEAHTLRTQYLVPGFEEHYKERGRPMVVMNKKAAIARRVATRHYRRRVFTATMQGPLEEITGMLSHVRDQIEDLHDTDEREQLNKMVDRLDEAVYNMTVK